MMPLSPHLLHRPLRILLGSLALSPLLLLPALGFAASPTNIDANTQAALQYAQAQLILPATRDGAMHPGMTVTREEFTVSVVDHFYMGEDFDHCYRNITSPRDMDFRLLFADVSKSHWSATHLCVAMHAGLIDGKRDAGFHPDSAITLAEASKIFAKAYGLLYPSQQPTRMPWYKPSMAALAMRGAIPSSARSSEPLTRGQMAQMFYALRAQPRYPVSRIVGEAPPPETASILLTTVSLPVATNPQRNIVDRPRATMASASLSGLTDEQVDILHHRGQAISRRMLLLKERENERNI